MKVWIFLDGRQQGPFSLEELLDMPVNENTKVWYEGLPKWYPAGSLDKMRPLFDGTLARGENTTAEHVEESAEVAETENVEVEEHDARVNEEVHEAVEVQQPVRPVNTNPYAPGQRSYRSAAAVACDEPCPPTYLGWSIFLTICCCSPVSLAALVASIFVSTYYNRGNLAKSKKASEVTAWLIMVAIALGFIPMMLMSSFLGD